MKASLTRWEEAETHAASTLAWQPEAVAATGHQDSVQAAPRRSGDSILQSLMRLWPRDGRRPQASARAMAELRAAFRAALADLADPTDGADDADDQDQRLREILRHIVHSRDPQDLWHLRAAIYTEVARARSQGEAERRLAELGQHFKSSKRRFTAWFA